MNDITYTQIIEHYGTEHQCRQAMEECAELIQAINKAVRYPDNASVRVQLMEEIADVKIMIQQLEEIFDISWKDGLQMYKYKQGRLFRRYAEDKQKEDIKELYGL